MPDLFDPTRVWFVVCHLYFEKCRLLDRQKYGLRGSKCYPRYRKGIWKAGCQLWALFRLFYSVVPLSMLWHFVKWSRNTTNDKWLVELAATSKPRDHDFMTCMMFDFRCQFFISERALYQQRIHRLCISRHASLPRFGHPFVLPRIDVWEIPVSCSCVFFVDFKLQSIDIVFLMETTNIDGRTLKAFLFATEYHPAG